MKTTKKPASDIDSSSSLFSKKKVQICAVIPLEDYAKLKKLAQKELTSQGQFVRKILHNHLLTIADLGKEVQP